MRKSFVSLVLFVLSLAACGGGGSGGATVATVNGVDISVGEVQMMRLDADANAAVADKAQFATDLTDAIINLAIIEAAKTDFGIDPSDDEVTAKIADLEGQIEAAQGVSAEEFFNQQGLPLERLDCDRTSTSHQGRPRRRVSRQHHASLRRRCRKFAHRRWAFSHDRLRKSHPRADRSRGDPLHSSGSTEARTSPQLRPKSALTDRVPTAATSVANRSGSMCPNLPPPPTPRPSEKPSVRCRASSGIT